MGGVKYMWEALESFNHEQRGAFLRFVWGRSTLPITEEWDQPFKVKIAGRGDDRLPCSHTCFFAIDLPVYSSVETCRAKLLYCITHCLAIDGDGNAARDISWDEDDED